jgi:hypothetical protein
VTDNEFLSEIRGGVIRGQVTVWVMPAVALASMALERL